MKKMSETARSSSLNILKTCIRSRLRCLCCSNGTFRCNLSSSFINFVSRRYNFSTGGASHLNRGCRSAYGILIGWVLLSRCIPWQLLVLNFTCQMSDKAGKLFVAVSHVRRLKLYKSSLYRLPLSPNVSPAGYEAADSLYLFTNEWQKNKGVSSD